MTTAKNIQKQALAETAVAVDAAGLEQVRVKYLGRKDGELNRLLRSLKDLTETERRRQGPVLQKLRERLEQALDQRRAELTATTSEAVLLKLAAPLDYRLPKIGHLHPLTETIRMINDHFLRLGYSLMDGPEIENDEYCFRRLNVPPDHPARDMQDTIYIEEPKYLLRTHTSSIEARVLAKYRPPFKVAYPGRTYRNEKASKTNHFIFHQYQGFVVLKEASLKDLFGTITGLFRKMYGPKVVIRFRNKYYPEVEPGVGPDMQCFNCTGKGCAVCKNVGWIEMGGAGIIHPNLLQMAGIDPKKWRGFAFGLGLDRWVMAKYQIQDIRTLLGGDLAYRYYQHESSL